MMRTPIWEPESKIVEEMFDTEGTLQPMNMHYFDVHNIYQPSPEGMDFIEALANTDADHIDLFKCKTVQIMLTAQQENWLLIDWLAFFMPQFLQLIIFWYWSNIVLPNLKTDEALFEHQNNICGILLNVISVYLLIMEIPIFIKSPINYSKKPIKWVNLAAIILMFINVLNPGITVEFW